MCRQLLTHTWKFMKRHLKDEGAAAAELACSLPPLPELENSARLMYRAWKAYEMVYKAMDEKYSTCLHCGYYPRALGLDANASSV